ncbi:MAG: hypothetical protein R3E79_59260 [Caldilineaceae bacterium]
MTRPQEIKQAPCLRTPIVRKSAAVGWWLVAAGQQLAANGYQIAHQVKRPTTIWQWLLILPVVAALWWMVGLRAKPATPVAVVATPVATVTAPTPKLRTRANRATAYGWGRGGLHR